MSKFKSKGRVWKVISVKHNTLLEPWYLVRHMIDKTLDNRYKRTRKCYATSCVRRADMKLFGARVSYKFRYRSNCDLLAMWELCPTSTKDRLCLSSMWGPAVAQAVSRWLPTAVAWVRVRTACGVCGGQCGTTVGFLRVLRLPLPIIIPPISPL
jgi:hypothetical protein